MAQSRNIVVIGAGFAGLWSALAARRVVTATAKDPAEASDIQVIVVAPEAQLVMRPRLYEPDPATKAAPLGDLFRTTGIVFVQGVADAIHRDKQQVEVVDQAGSRSFIAYERLVLAAGSRLSYPSIPGLREHAFSVDQLGEATKLEAHVKGLALLAPSAARNTVVVCGAGFTGIEAATEMPARLRTALGRDAETRVILVARGDSVGDSLGPGPRPVIEQALLELGVETRLGETIVSVDASGVTTARGERIEASTVVWAGGVAATPLTKQVPGQKDSFGRLFVDANLRLPEDEHIYVAGDAVCAATDNDGHYSMPSCQHAINLGRYCGHNAAASLLGEAVLPYSQLTYVTCLDLGAYGAVLTNGWQRRIVVTRRWAKLVKNYINQKLIYPPDFAHPAKALAAADPHMLSSFSNLLWERVFRFVLSLVGFFTQFSR